jgi:hypothetical protein
MANAYPEGTGQTAMTWGNSPILCSVGLNLAEPVGDEPVGPAAQGVGHGRVAQP